MQMRGVRLGRWKEVIALGSRAGGGFVAGLFVEGVSENDARPSLYEGNDGEARIEQARRVVPPAAFAFVGDECRRSIRSNSTSGRCGETLVQSPSFVGPTPVAARRIDPKGVERCAPCF